MYTLFILLIIISTIVVTLTITLCKGKMYYSHTNIKFNEKYYKSNSDYELKVDIGKNIAKEKKIIFTGLVRNVQHIKLNIDRIKFIGENFKDYMIVLYENDSTDGTDVILKNLSDKKVLVISEKLNNKEPKKEGQHSLKRFEKMSLLRNKNLEIIRQQEFSDYDYVFLIDWDYYVGWSLNGIFHSLSFNKDAISSYGISYYGRHLYLYPIYYDPLAYETINEERVKKHSGPTNPKKLVSHPTMRFGQDIFEVNSAFCGAIIYKKEIIDDLDIYYEGYDCEHITFHKNMKKKGYKIFVNPSFIVNRGVSD